MNLLHTAKTVCSLAAVAALTACGGGGEKGPAWAQTTKANLTKAYPYVKAPAAFVGECRDAGQAGYSLRRAIVPISDDGTVIVQQGVIRYYASEDCNDPSRLFSIVTPKNTLTVTGTGVDGYSGEPVRLVRANFAGGEVFVSVEADGVAVQPTPGNESNELSITYGNGLTLIVDRQQTSDIYNDIILIKDGFLYFGDLSTVDTDDPNSYPTEIDLSNDVYEFLP